MKTMKHGDTIVRVKEVDVTSKLNAGFKFVPKSEWKTNVRGPIGKLKKSEDGNS